MAAEFVPTDLEGFRRRAAEKDRADPLARFREAFAPHPKGLVYLDGNSLGRPLRASQEAIRLLVEVDWPQRLIRGWGSGWMNLPVELGDLIAPLVGAGRGQILVADSTTVNLHKLVRAALALRPGRSFIVSDDLNFPSDLDVVDSVVTASGGDLGLRIASSPDGIAVPGKEILDAIDRRTALVVLSHPAFRSGALYDVAAVTARAHDAGALVLWDLSHAAGVLPLDLDRWGVDLAVGCTYKYLNGGPGAPAWLFVRRDLQEEILNPLPGWIGRADPFDFARGGEPAPGLRRFLSGTPSVLSLVGLRPALELTGEAGISRLRTKSMALTEFARELGEAWLEPLGFRLASPRDASQRGSHLTLAHPAARQLVDGLVEAGSVIPDFRPPDQVRLGLAPLSTSFGDVLEGLLRIGHAAI